MRDVDAAWLAGLIEGEGCLYQGTANGRPRFELSVSMVDEDVIRRAHEVSGVGYVAFYDRANVPNASDQWKWRVGKRDEIRAVVDAVLPLMGNRRATKFLAFIEWHDGLP